MWKGKKIIKWTRMFRKEARRNEELKTKYVIYI